VIEPKLVLDAFPEVRRKATALPDLIYAPKKWTKLEQRDWTGKSHKNRYILLNGRQIEESEIETYVLPISLAHYRVGSSPRLNLDTACPVILYLDPNPNLGYTCDMLNAWTRFQFLGHRAMDNRSMNAMEKFEMGLPDSIWMENVNDILDGLQKICHDDKPNATIDLFSIHQVDISIAEDLGIKGDMGQTREEEPDETEDSIEVDLTDENEEESSP
jgi:hypothetical protein